MGSIQVCIIISLADRGGGGCVPAHGPLWDQILSFLHTFLVKRTHVRGPHPPNGSTPSPYGKSWCNEIYQHTTLNNNLRFKLLFRNNYNTYLQFHVGGRSRISRRKGVHPLGGHGPPMRALFSENVCENKRIGSHKGWHAPSMPPLDPPMHVVYCRDVIQHKVQVTTDTAYSTSQLHMMLLV